MININDFKNVPLHQHDQAIEKLNFYLQQKSITDKQKALINLYLGKIYWKKEEQVTCTYSTSSSIYMRGGNVSHFLGSRRIGVCSKRMFKQAVNFFDSAIHYDPTLKEAYYRKGKALKYGNEVGKAYECFILAAKNSNEPKYLKKCKKLFSEYPDLPFQEVRSLDSTHLNGIFLLLYKRDAFSRMEACHNILKRLPQASEQVKNQIKEEVKTLAETKILCFSIPYTGDSDNRVKQLAQTILSECSN